MRNSVPLILFALTACGQGANDNSANPMSVDDAVRALGQPGAQGASAQSGTAAAEGIDCGSVRGQGGEGPDVVGVTIGMSAEQAYAKIACANPALRVEYSDQPNIRLPQLPGGQRPRTAIVGQGGGEQIEALLVGLPGQERVVAIRRDVNFSDGQEPEIGALQNQLRAKYGALQIQESGSNFRASIVRENAAQPLCGVIGDCAPSTHGRLSLYERCGLSVAVHADRSNRNPSLVRRLIVAMTDGAFGTRQIEAVTAHAQGAVQQSNDAEAGEAAKRVPAL